MFSSSEPDFIDGIFNYCDRWCERCPFTARCRVYASEQERFTDPESRDLQNAAFWESMHSIFAETKEMLLDMAEEMGISPEELQQAAVEMDDDDDHFEKQLQNPLVSRARNYGNTVNEWFKTHEDLFEQKSEELSQHYLLGLSGNDPEAEAVRLSDAVDVIRWYQHQICVKLMRALGRDPEDDLFPEEDIQRDANGSVKVALLGIDRSIAAWIVVRDSLSDSEEPSDLLDILVELNSLRKESEKAFPNARAFQRPGFDDPEVL